ncbi:malectin domain-containing carbohydrate-binding protein [Sphingobacterium deserti]|uniref:Glycoside hydrolase family 2 sugar binding protein n=1 Tax=Sphingobacterium deserti TaxID=1229276 RepID=A0A0B8T299_9SPHI|nr:malectin domain-containing carbohydrate-binding protein [Sphingobacterium deserti]KGE14991.1 glycoside hydrolase family 2 sugar binding protein [Sphingobacterium deserti]
MRKAFFVLCLLYVGVSCVRAQDVRQIISLDKRWSTAMDEHDTLRYNGFEKNSFQEDKNWRRVDVPHNWDSYAGYRRQIHGNLHGYAWYRKTFTIKERTKSKRFYLFFEGVGSYATVWLNGKQIGYHAGGRTTFTLDATDAIYADGRQNILAVRADHPAEIRDLPWVDGGCSTERGFSEGSQPLGIFRPVSIIVKNEVNIAPFGVHYWNDETANDEQATIQQRVEIQNTTAKARKLKVVTYLLDAKGKRVGSSTDQLQIEASTTKEISLSSIQLSKPHLWEPQAAYLYSLETRIQEGNKVLDKLQTPYGVRAIRWPKGLKPVGSNQLLVNGKPVFIHGIAEYEHKLGSSHAFTDQEISARVRDMKAMGFNSFRDAHQPHNLRYNHYWDENGILLWTQMAAHIWFDTPAFRTNFKQLLRDWVKERRNSPSVFLWGIENESTLPEDFARECMEIIRSMDPTASVQRLVTTCNGGSGTDWDVPQNWTGTYGGDHHTYGEDLKRQLLVGEYGAWRTLELHSEAPYLPNHSVYSEDRFTEILETKIRLADSVKKESIGHYLWLWNSHDNPGRVQGGEGYRDMDKIGPVNYKGLLTPWGEPTDAYYMYRAHYGEKSRPMVYIASHTWPNRWLSPGTKDGIRIYSNCEEVELFNDIESIALGKQKNPGLGRAFEFNGIPIQYNVLYVEGRNAGKVVARDTIVLHNLPASPNFEKLLDRQSELIKGDKSLEYLYRVNCGGDTYTDTFGQIWKADQAHDTSSAWGSYSWADDYEIASFFASQRRTFDPIKGTADWSLFQSFRYGLDKLGYRFDMPNGKYRVELYFSEPWVGTGGGGDATGMRLFDVALNGETVEHDLDIWKEVGHDNALKRVYTVDVRDGQLQVHFPHVAVGQAIIQAIAIAPMDKSKEKYSKSSQQANLPLKTGKGSALHSWMDIGQMYNKSDSLSFHYLPGFLYGSSFFKAESTNPLVVFKKPTNLYILGQTPVNGMELTGDSVVNNRGEAYQVYRKVLAAGEEFQVPVTALDLIAFQEQSGLQPAYDLKESANYKANAVKVFQKMDRVDFLKQERLRYAEDNGFLEFQMKVGVADVYSLTLKYHNEFKDSKSLTLEVRTLDGSVLKPAEKLQLDPTRVGKWNYATTTTGSMINAGTYRVIVRGLDAKAIYIDGLEVQ